MTEDAYITKLLDQEKAIKDGILYEKKYVEHTPYPDMTLMQIMNSYSYIDHTQRIKMVSTLLGKDVDKEFALEHASLIGSTEIVHLLIHHEAVVTPKAIYNSCLNENTEIMDILISHMRAPVDEEIINKILLTLCPKRKSLPNKMRYIADFITQVNPDLVCPYCHKTMKSHM